MSRNVANVVNGRVCAAEVRDAGVEALNERNAAEGGNNSGQKGDKGDKGDKGNKGNKGNKKNDKAQDTSNSSIAEIRASRIAKAEALLAQGRSAYAYKFERTHSAKELQEKYVELGNGEEEDGVQVKVAGRVMMRRVMGKLAFAKLTDQSGSIQVSRIFCCRSCRSCRSYQPYQRYQSFRHHSSLGLLFVHVLFCFGSS